MQQIIFDCFLGLSCIVAWVRGGTPERVAALLLAVAVLLSVAVVGSGAEKFAKPEWGLFFVDVMLFFTLLWLALSADRYWPMWLSSLQFVSVLMHPAFGLSPERMAFAYAVASIVWSYPMLLILVAGALRHDRRRHRLNLGGLAPEGS